MMAAYPTWGVLVKATPERVTSVLQPLLTRLEVRSLVVRTSGEWTGAFNMEPGDPSEDEGARLLQAAGFVPVYFFDFWKHDYTCKHWNGHDWIRVEDPAELLETLGIAIPGTEQPVPSPARPITSRHATVLEGVGLVEARLLAPGVELHAEAGSRGAIVYGADANTRCDLAERAPRRVFEVHFIPATGDFSVEIMRGEDCIGAFMSWPAGAWSGVPVLDSIDGETQPEHILDKLGLPRSFLAPLELEAEPTATTNT